MKQQPHGGVELLPQSAGMAAGGGPTGGDGGVTTFHDNGGRVLTNCRIVLVFWGSDWSNPSATPSAAAVSSALSGIVSGPWSSALSQYRGIGPMVIEQTSFVTSSDPPTSFTNADIQTMLKNQIDNGTLPAPNNAIDRVYCVLLPTGHSSGDTSFVGQHQFFDRSGARAYYAWVSNDGTLTSGNSIPKVFTHEMAEAVTNPNVGGDGNPDAGITVDVGSDTNEEIGDVCNNTFSIVRGVAVEAYWSQLDGACVLPRAEEVRIATFTDVTFDPGDWNLVPPNRPDEVITYQATGGNGEGSSLTIKRDGSGQPGHVVFDLDFKKGQEIKVVGNVVHLAEGAFPGVDEGEPRPNRG